MKISVFCSILLLALHLSGGAPSFAAGEARAALYTARAGSGLGYSIPENLTENERFWFKTFQEGNVLSEGWQQISADILARTPEEERSTQKVALANLGMKIGTEWCRHNNTRKVSTAMLRQWGDLLKKTARQNPRSLPQAIVRIDREVDAALK